MSEEPTPPLRIKPRLPVSSDQDSAQTPVSPFLPEITPGPVTDSSPVAHAPSPAPQPASTAPTVATTPPLPKKSQTIHIRAPKTPSDDAALFGKPKASAPTAKKNLKSSRGLLVVLLLVVMLGGGVFAYRFYFPPASSANVPLPEKPAPAATPPAPAEAVTTAPPAPSNPVPAPSAAEPPRVANRPATAPRPAPTVTTEVSLASGITMSVPEAGPSTAASPAFRSFAAEAKIGGVRPNATPPSALINNRLVRLGQPVDNGLGLTITLSAVDADKRELTFKDRSGATVTRRY